MAADEAFDMMEVENFEKAIKAARELSHILVMRKWKPNLAGQVQGIEELLRQDLFNRHGKETP